MRYVAPKLGYGQGYISLEKISMFRKKDVQTVKYDL